MISWRNFRDITGRFEAEAVCRKETVVKVRDWVHLNDPACSQQGRIYGSTHHPLRDRCALLNNPTKHPQSLMIGLSSSGIQGVKPNDERFSGKAADRVDRWNHGDTNMKPCWMYVAYDVDIALLKHAFACRLPASECRNIMWETSSSL